MQPDDCKRDRLEYLLADFKALKAEIARRSNLQRIAMVAYIAVYAWLIPQIASNQATMVSIAALWVAGVLALLFYTREGLEIIRLGMLIRDRIASAAAQLVNTTPEVLIPSEVVPGNAAIDRITRLYNLIFMWSVFFVIPALTTVLFVSCRYDQLSLLLRFDTPIPYITLIILVSVAGIILLLKKRP